MSAQHSGAVDICLSHNGMMRSPQTPDCICKSGYTEYSAHKLQMCFFTVLRYITCSAS